VSIRAEPNPSPTGAEAVAEWRREVLHKVFRYMFFLLATILLVEAGLSLRSGQWHALPALALAVLFQGIAAFARRASVRTRALAFVGAALLGVGTTLPVLGFAFPVPFVVAVMTLTLLALCVGQRFALLSLLSLVVLVLLDAAYVCFARAEPFPATLVRTQGVLDPNRFPNWIRVTLIFGAVCLAIIGAVGFLVRRLEDAVARNAKLFESLEQASHDRIRVLEEREILQEKVRRGNELQLLGLLSATVAHDFNNLLMVILGNASSLKEEVRGQAREDVADITRAGEQAADLCRRLLTLSGERISGDEIAELNRVIEEELPILRRLVTSRVKLEWNPGAPLWFRCARTEMRQALLNLCANARDAMPQGGRLLVSTNGARRPRPGEETAESFACLVLRDDGIGMDASTRARIFEPFFTTKGKSKGTGLGMAVVAAAVERHQGFLELETEPGQGTCFSLFFPSVETPADEVPVSGGSSHELSGRERVLVVDDDEGARKMLTRYLQKYGYTLLVANDGQEALELLERGETVDLIVSDAVMPRLGGRALFDAVTQEHPRLPFLFCSGFAAGTIPDNFLASPRRALLAKPFSERALLETVRRLLDAASA
jgi:signal transduction histidine kinase/CheY-like chemotaxis protein